MPKDPRLYMTFPIDMHRHPKVSRLPVAVRWTFFEMNGEARLADNDGVFTEAEAEYLFPVKHLQALVSSHPERPLVVREAGTYSIRDYAEHQQTKAEREQRAETNRENGRRGGRPPKNSSGTDSVSTRLQTEANVTQKNPESESESELEIPDDVTKEMGSSQVPSNARSGLDPNRVRAAGVTNLASVRSTLEATCGEPVSELGAVLLAEAICSKAKRHVSKVDAYVASVCRRTPEEVKSAYFDLDIGAVA